ncbi:MAG: YbhB/YbcL family Raf kinase inhibitor-like protein [bacterium]|nr:YbhB/YbcL family Raf kinase inhibitor-like protein [bacterium]
MEKLILKSVFRNKEFIPAKYARDGENINPLLEIRNVSEAAKSLVLIMDDPDATSLPAGQKAWDHWIVWNIDPKSQYIPEGELPEGARVGKNTRGEEKYGGPYPPVGSKPHRYFFKLYALDVVLELPAGSNKKEVEEAMIGHVLEQASLVGMYQRKTDGF